MSAQRLAENPTFVWLQEQLRAVAQQLRAGMDVAPSLRFRLEGLTAALIANGFAIDELERDCITAGAGAIIVARDGDTLHFDCWQQRAPVYPTTAD